MGDIPVVDGDGILYLIAQEAQAGTQHHGLLRAVVGGHAGLTVLGLLRHKALDVGVRRLAVLGEHEGQIAVLFLGGEALVRLIAVEHQHNLLPRVAAVIHQQMHQLVAAFIHRPAVLFCILPCADDIVAIDDQQRLHALREDSTRYIMTPAATEAFRLSM